MQMRLGPIHVSLALIGCLLATIAGAQEINIGWVAGPTTVDLGDSLAKLKVEEGFVFANSEDTRTLMEYMGNPPSHSELGFVTPADDSFPWYIVFEYDPIGFVRDDEGADIDADALLNSIKQATDKANQERQRIGGGSLHVVGWFEKPHYDETTHNLVWAIEAVDEAGDHVVNYNVRVLGRRGFTSVTLVTEPDVLGAYKHEVDSVLSGYSYQQGSRYADFVAGDHVAEIGLTALIAGGAGAAAVKLGLFAALAKFLGKMWKLVVVGLAALLGSLKKLFGGGQRRGNMAPY